MRATLKTLSHLDYAMVAHLDLGPEQEQFVDPLDWVFAQLRNSAHPELEHPFAIVFRQEVVGFFVLREKAASPEWAPPNVITSHSIRIGRVYQGNRYGRAAIGLIVEWVLANRPGINRIMAAINARNSTSRNAFMRVGFRDTGATYLGPVGLQNIFEYQFSSG
ncbi:GNAT family N-acetyltransferase [Bradyrhizobium genosp. P]|uniref:GNAT family N-acetyltransferase n=1 Tax=Bradyrhizobium genosp. P TaxID=83641 RepID=UPI003CE77FC4